MLESHDSNGGAAKLEDAADFHSAGVNRRASSSLAPATAFLLYYTVPFETSLAE
jgi:hypothetical protein